MSEKKKKAIAWQCRRGMLELDVTLERFLQKQFDGASAAEQADFMALLNESDHDLYQWLICNAEPPKPYQNIIETLKTFS